MTTMSLLYACSGTLHIQFRLSILVDAIQYIMIVSGFSHSVRRGSIDSSTAGVHVSGLKRLPPLRRENQSEQGWVGCVKAVRVLLYCNTTKQLKSSDSDAGVEADRLYEALTGISFLFSLMLIESVCKPIEKISSIFQSLQLSRSQMKAVHPGERGYAKLGL